MINLEIHAAILTDKLRRNVNAFYADAINYPTFSATQRDVWDEIRSAGASIHNIVLRNLRHDLNATVAS